MRLGLLRQARLWLARGRRRSPLGLALLTLGLSLSEGQPSPAQTLTAQSIPIEVERTPNPALDAPNERREMRFDRQTDDLETEADREAIEAELDADPDAETPTDPDDETDETDETDEIEVEADSNTEQAETDEADDDDAIESEADEETEADEDVAEDEAEDDEADEGITRAEFLQDPRNDEDLDPLLPEIVVDRPLSPLELRRLRQDLDQLRIEGQLAYNRQETQTAYEIWKRELRLRRVLGLQPEAQALGEVGAVAWADNQTAVVNMITARLLEIRQAELDPATRQLDEEPEAEETGAEFEGDRRDDPIDYELLQTVGAALRALRDYDNAVASYEQILLEARRRNDIIVQEAALNALGELHMGWFRYEAAAAVYQELLAFAQNRNDEAAEELYLAKLAEAYDQGEFNAPAIAAQEQLTELYQQDEDFRSATAVKLAIARNHRALGDYRQAAVTYQEAYAIAQTQQQYAYAADALNGLAEMYLDINRLDDALFVYQLLVEVERQSYNVYGEMETFDRIGQIHEQRGDLGQAVSAYRLGLALADALSFRTEYFVERINALLNPVPPIPESELEPQADPVIDVEVEIVPGVNAEIELDEADIEAGVNEAVEAGEAIAPARDRLAPMVDDLDDPDDLDDLDRDDLDREDEPGNPAATEVEVDTVTP